MVNIYAYYTYHSFINVSKSEIVVNDMLHFILNHYELIFIDKFLKSVVAVQQ